MIEFDIAIAGKKNPLKWKNQKWSWKAILDKISHPIITSETQIEYWKGTKEFRETKKDQGGFVGGYLKDGIRNKTGIQHRSVITLDADNATDLTWYMFQELFSCAAGMYTTHSHTSEAYRIRIIIPLSRNINLDEHQAVSRKIADMVGMTAFDKTTFENERLMFWPSRSTDGEFIFDSQEGPPLDPDTILSKYANAMDASCWPQHPNEVEDREYFGSKQEDPTTKDGLIGAFCRAYDIYSAIDEFLPDIYEETGTPDRYTYTKGTSFGGAIVYQNGLFLYSHHGTDPTSGHTVNAFDMVRMHLFGHLDAGQKNPPSFKKMLEKVQKLPDIAVHLHGDDFGKVEVEESETDPDAWKKALIVDKSGKYEPTITNYAIIMSYDPELKDKIAYNAFPERHTLMQPVPKIIPQKAKSDETTVYPKYFTDDDGAQLRGYIEQKYDIFNLSKYKDAMRAVSRQNAFHPVRDYLNPLVWDGVSRIDTLLIDYLGAENTKYVRTVTRKTILAGVKRVMEPGVKFDYLLTLVGPQGAGKSRFVKKLAVYPEWLNQSFIFTTVGNKSAEAVRGKWIIEVSELVGLKKADVNNIKQFFSTEIDSYRQAFGEYSDDFRRQCIFIGTTNEHDFITDPTGGRRFWPVQVAPVAKYEIDEMPIDQVWAEALHIYKNSKENLWLDAIEEEGAKEVQQQHSEEEAKEGIIMQYVNALIPDNWYEMDQDERYQFINHGIIAEAHPLIERTRICAAEVYFEALGGTKANFNNVATRPINRVLKKMAGWTSSKGKLSFGVYGQYTGFEKEI